MDGQTLVVANYYNDSITVFTGGLGHWSKLSELDLRPGKSDPAMSGIAGGEYPFWVVVKGAGSSATAYVSSIRDREIVVVKLSGQPEWANPRGRPSITARIKVKGQPNKMTVNKDRLINSDKEPQNWLMNHRTYDAQRYSPLDQINASSAGKLQSAAWQRAGSATSQRIFADELESVKTTIETAYAAKIDLQSQLAQARNGFGAGQSARIGEIESRLNQVNSTLRQARASADNIEFLIAIDRHDLRQAHAEARALAGGRQGQGGLQELLAGGGDEVREAGGFKVHEPQAHAEGLAGGHVLHAAVVHAQDAGAAVLHEDLGVVAALVQERLEDLPQLVRGEGGLHGRAPLAAAGGLPVGQEGRLGGPPIR